MQKIFNKLDALFLIIIVLFPTQVLACSENEIDTIFVCVPKGEKGLPMLIGQAFSWVAGVIGSFAILGLIYAAFVYITSAGNPDQIAKAKDIIWTSLAAVIIIIFSYALFKLLGVAQ